MILFRAGEPLDRLIAEHVMGWKRDAVLANVFRTESGWRSTWEHGAALAMDPYSCPFLPSVVTAHAKEVAQCMVKLGYRFESVYDSWELGSFRASFISSENLKTVDEAAFGILAGTLPLAICRAALIEDPRGTFMKTARTSSAPP